MFRWFDRIRESRSLRRHAIPDLLWDTTLSRYPFLRRPASEEAELRRLTSLFLSQKEFTAAGGLRLTDAMAVTIAAQACLPILRLGLDLYAGFVGIVLHPGEVLAKRHWEDDTGLVHEYHEALVGEAMDGGPVMLSWSDVVDADQTASVGVNVVIHEFIHVLDLADGQCDGVPPMPSRQARAHWLSIMEPAFESFCRDVEAADAGIAADTLLDPYGAESLEEFFPVAAEAFFTVPREFQRTYPLIHPLFAEYFRQAL